MLDLGAGQQKFVAGEAVDLAGFQRRHGLVAILDVTSVTLRLSS